MATSKKEETAPQTDATTRSGIDQVLAQLNAYRTHPNATGENVNKAYMAYQQLSGLKQTIDELLSQPWPESEA